MENQSHPRNPARSVRSAFENLQHLADAARASADQLLSLTTLTSPEEGGSVVRALKYFNWELPKDHRRLRYRAVQDLDAFSDPLDWILAHHDASAEATLKHYSSRAYEAMRQQGQTQIGSIEEARQAVETFIVKGVEAVRHLYDLLEGELVLIPDTNVVVDWPKFEDYDFGLGSLRIVLLSIVLSELDLLKRKTRDETQKRVRHAIRSIKQHGDVGNLLDGVRLNENIILMTSPVEPTTETLPSLLRIDVPDDRFVATALVFSQLHPHTKLAVVSGDLNVMNKARAAGLSAVDPDPLDNEARS